MKELVIRYGTFLIVPFILMGVILLFSTLKVKEKLPVTLVYLSDTTGIAYIPKLYSIPIQKGDTLLLVTSESNTINCQVKKVLNESNNRRVQVYCSSNDRLSNNTIGTAYIFTKDISMLKLISLKIFNY